MIIELLIIIFLLWIFTYNIKGSAFYIPVQGNDISKINELKIFLNDILEHSEYEIPKYEIQISKNKTYVTNKFLINILLKNNNQYYNKDTLYYVSLHEMAHILTNEEHHTKKFIKTENKLIKIAKKLKYFDTEIKIDENYPIN